MVKKKSPFEYMAKMLSNTSDYGLDYNKFMINKILSMNDTTLILSEFLNLSSLTDEMHHDYIQNIIPKNKFNIRYDFPYIKTKKNLEKIQDIMDYFGVNEDIAKEYEKHINEDFYKKIRKRKSK